MGSFGRRLSATSGERLWRAPTQKAEPLENLTSPARDTKTEINTLNPGAPAATSLLSDRYFSSITHQACAPPVPRRAHPYSKRELAEFRRSANDSALSLQEQLAATEKCLARSPEILEWYQSLAQQVEALPALPEDKAESGLWDLARAFVREVRDADVSAFFLALQDLRLTAEEVLQEKVRWPRRQGYLVSSPEIDRIWARCLLAQAICEIHGMRFSHTSAAPFQFLEFYEAHHADPTDF